MKPRLSTGALVALFFALILLGLAIVAYVVLGPRGEPAAESSWRPVEATVTSAGLRSESPENGPDAGKTFYRPIVIYAYEFGGAGYKSGIVPVETPPPEGVWTRQSAEKAFPPGTKIVAYVDPEDPSRSSLVPPSDRSDGARLFVGAFVFLWILVLFGVFVLFPAIRKSARGEADADGDRAADGSDAAGRAAPPVSEHYASTNVRSHKPVLQAGRLLVVPAPAPHLWWTAALMIPAGFALLAVALLTDLPERWGWNASSVAFACCFAFCFWVGGGGVLAVAILTLKKGMRAAFDRVRDRMTVERRIDLFRLGGLDAPLSDLSSVLLRCERRVKTIHHRGAQHVAPMIWDSWGVWLRLRGGRDVFLLENGSRRAQEAIARAIADYARVPLETL